MSHFNKLFLLIMGTPLLLGVVFADDDCLLTTSLVSISESAWSPYSGALPYSDLKLAYNHLLSYCCNADLYPENLNSVCSQSSNEVYLKSPYLFEHLVDVGIRHYDVLGAYSGQTIDAEAQEWYNFLTLSGEKPLTPLLVEGKYKQHWTLTKIPLFQDEAGNITNYLPLYTTSGFSLRDKYYNLCFVLKSAYENVLQPIPDKRPILIGDQYKQNSYYNKCLDLVYRRVGEERVYAQTTILERSTNTLEQTIESYSMTNFVRDRLWTLYDKLKAIVELFGKIASQAPLSKRCSK